ncbi:MAG: AAA family ATPase [Candidatus Magasanikbacteria bacterium]|nr:AAA family ATPase [Candidatus Magasanikbacteria bacterium]
MEIIGHKLVQEFFSRTLEAGRIGHAYVLVGPDHIGKTTLVHSIATRLLDTTVQKLMSHPDFIVVGQLRDEKTDALKRDISIDQIIELKSSLSRQAFSGGYSVALVTGAEKMSTAAANSLLKTLEEPKANTVLFLTTTDDEMLPQTILSRAQVLYFSRVSENEIRSALEREYGSVKKIDEIISDSRGLPGRAIEWLQNGESYDLYKEEEKRFNSLFGKSFHDKIATIEPLFSDKSDTVTARENLISILCLWELLLRNRGIMNQGDVYSWVKIEQKIIQAKRLLQKNIHPRLLVEEVLLMIP